MIAIRTTIHTPAVTPIVTPVLLPFLLVTVGQVGATICKRATFHHYGCLDI